MLRGEHPYLDQDAALHQVRVVTQAVKMRGDEAVLRRMTRGLVLTNQCSGEYLESHAIYWTNKELVLPGLRRRAPGSWR